MKLFVDDIRKPPKGWDLAKNFTEAISMLTVNFYDELSLDHDLGDIINGREYTGYDILNWLEWRASINAYVPKKIHVHSANPAGVKRMQVVIEKLASKK